MRIGIIDLGTLSLRFDVYSEGENEPCLRHRAMPRLGDLVFSTGILGRSGTAALLTQLREVRSLAEQAAVDALVAVGTSVFREAQDCSGVLAEVERQTGIAVQVLSGIEEARLTARGILSREGALPISVVCVDIGGGSTEITWCEDGTPRHSISLDLGVIRLREQFFREYTASDRPLDTARLTAARLEIRHGLSIFAEDFSRFCPTELIGSSGTIRTLEHLGLVNTAGCSSVGVSAFFALLEEFVRYSFAELVRRPGVEASRADVLLPGMILLDELLQRLQVGTIRVSRFSLRHGVLDALRSGSTEVKVTRFFPGGTSR